MKQSHKIRVAQQLVAVARTLLNRTAVRSHVITDIVKSAAREVSNDSVTVLNRGALYTVIFRKEQTKPTLKKVTATVLRYAGKNSFEVKVVNQWLTDDEGSQQTFRITPKSKTAAHEDATRPRKS